MSKGNLENLTIGIDFKIKNKALDNLDKKLDKIAPKTTKNFSKVEQSINKVVGKSKGLTKIKSYFDRMTGSANKSKSKIREVGSELDKTASKGSKGFGSIAGGVFKGNLALQAFNMGLQGIKASISGIIKLSDKWTNNTARLNLLTGGDANLTSQLKSDIFKASQNSRGDFGATTDTVAKLGLLAGDAFKGKDGQLNSKELVDFTELLNKQFTVAGADDSMKESGLLQLSQAMASGKLQGDEFRSIMENAPLLADAIAKYTGKSKGELKEMSSEGLITADIIKKALFASADDINEKFNSMPMTFGSAWTMIKNEAEYSLQGILSSVNGVLNSDFGKGVFNTILETVRKIPSAVSLVTTKLQELGTWLGERIAPHAESFKATFNDMKNNLTVLWEQIQPILADWGAKFASIFEKVIPLAMRLWNEVLGPFIDWAVNVMWPILKPIIEGVGNAFMSALDGIMDAIDGLVTALKGVIQFLKGVFTGDWQLALEGIKNIFSGVWNALGGIAKGALNGVISQINGFLSGINIKIPDWIPEDWGGGKTLSLPQIPLLARGTHNTPDTFIAGENGPELITNMAGRRVIPAGETDSILSRYAEDNQQGNTNNNYFTFNINGVQDPQAVAREVENTLKNVFGSISRRSPKLREI